MVGQWRQLALLCGFLVVVPLLGWYSLQITKNFYDYLSDPTEFSTLFLFFLIMTVIKIAQTILSLLENYSKEKLGLCFKGKLELQLFHMINPQVITFIETPEYQQNLSRLKHSLFNMQITVTSFLGIFFQLVNVCVYSFYALQYSYTALFIVIIFCFPRIIFDYRQMEKADGHWGQISQEEMESSNLSQLITNPHTIKEILLFSMKPFLITKWNRVYTSLIAQKLSFRHKELRGRSILALIEPVSTLIVQAILLHSVTSRNISLGEYMAISTSLMTVEGAVYMFSLNFKNINNIFIFQRNYQEFMLKYSPFHESDKITSFEINEVSLKNLSFSYFGARMPSLKNINLDIKQGEFIAIVGQNGSGKSTLAKVLAGLHQVEPGQLFYNGIDIHDIHKPHLFEQISALNQDYIKYPFTMFENIVLDSDNSENSNNLHKLFSTYPNLLSAGMKEFLHNLLGIEYLNSQQLSGGQWQRIALARSLYKNSRILLLDEATSELDPESAISLTQDILRYRMEFITIMVTHNLTLTKYMKRILVMEEGEIIEEGTFEELVCRNGKFLGMLNAQNLKNKEEVSNESYPFSKIIT